MSGLVVGAVFSSGLYVGADLMVLVKLADYCDDAGICYPGLDTLARMTGLTRRSVQRILRRLEKDGRDKAAGIAGTITTRRNGGRGKVNKYELNLTRLEAAKLGWYRSAASPARKPSFAAMAVDPVFGPALRRRLPGQISPAILKGDSDDIQKGDSDDIKKGDSKMLKGDSDDAKGDIDGAQRATGESPESIIESEKDSVTPERASDKSARGGGRMEDWLAVRRALRDVLGQDDFADFIAQLRFVRDGWLQGPDPHQIDRAAYVAGTALAEAGFVKLASAAGGREIDL